MWKKYIVDAQTQKKCLFLICMSYSAFLSDNPQRNKAKNNMWNILLRIDQSVDIKLDHLTKKIVQHWSEKIEFFVNQTIDQNKKNSMINTKKHI